MTTSAAPDSTQAVPQPALRGEPHPDECEILLIRHGRSADVVPGSVESTDPPLHVLGVEQAARLAARLQSKQIDA
ncbi:MAG TPA: histidine phosphatase family protein, partial [Ilumatobacteraceae bacterium]|nr:histidine phosphatase family protein [Ilumatobacteraceae bacterium]